MIMISTNFMITMHMVAAIVNSERVPAREIEQPCVTIHFDFVHSVGRAGDPACAVYVILFERFDVKFTLFA